MLKRNTLQMSGTEILPNLWLTDKNVAINQKFLKSKKIQVVINCTKEQPFSQIGGMTQHRIPVSDTLQYDDTVNLYQYLPKITSLMGQYYQRRVPMLVHCYAGRQRAATVMAAFLMRYLGMDWTNAVKIIQTKRASAFTPGINFAQALKSWNHQYGSGRADSFQP